VVYFCSTGRFLRSRRAGGERRVGSSAQCGQSCAAELSLVTVPTDRVCRLVCTDPERAERYGDVRWGRSWASFRALGVDRASCPARWGGSDVCVRAAARLSALAPRAAEKHTLRPSGRVYSEVRRACVCGSCVRARVPSGSRRAAGRCARAGERAVSRPPETPS
jgi:hypothetical protein